MKSAVLAVGCAALLFGWGARSAWADTYQFTETGTADTFSFDLTTPLTGDVVAPSSFYFMVLGGVFDGVFQDVDPAFAGNELDLAPGAFLVYEFFTDQNLYTGTTSDPSFTPGSYMTTEEQFSDTSTGTLTITDLSSPATTPEPSSLVLLGTGLLGVLGVMRRRALPS